MTNPNDRMADLKSKLGAATVALDVWTLANGESVPAMTNQQIEEYTALLKAKAEAKQACRAEWHSIHRGTHKDAEMPVWMM